MTTRETSAEIEEAAFAWAARVDGGALAPGEQAVLEGWLAGDMRRLGAFARAQAMLVRLESAQALGPSYDPEDFCLKTPMPAPTRRRLLQLGGAVAACGALGAGFLLSRPAALDYASQTGQVRRLALADGTVIHLNTASAIEVRFSDKARMVLLKAGEALFEVAQDAGRPFIVTAGKTSLRALDTVFSVRRQMGAAVRVMVRKGTVELRRGGGQPLDLRANMLAQVDDDQAVPLRVDSIDHADVDSGLSWLEGNLTFRAARLDDAADEFARYNGEGVLQVDPSLRAHRISGAFAAKDPEGFARAVATSYGLRVEHEGAVIRLLPSS